MAYLVFEYCDKGDLFCYVKSMKTRFDSKLCRSMFHQVLSGINFMHEKCRVAHLDIKLENLVLDSSYMVKVIDFAFSEPIDK